MQRISSAQLQQWLEKPKRKPLVLRGARQVGKSTLIRQFATESSLDLLEINLEQHRGLDQVFGSLDPQAIRTELEAHFGRPLRGPQRVLFLDEIQATPQAIAALRYLHESFPEVPILAAGSLLEFTLADHSFSMPVGRVIYHHLGPMTFYEFLLAIDPDLCSILDQLDPRRPLAQRAHERLSHRQRQFLIVGGMPEAILAFRETGSLEPVLEVHRSLVQTYEDDFGKYARRGDLTLLQRVFRSVPRLLGQKVKYVNISRDNRPQEIRQMIDLLVRARVCHEVLASHCQGIPLHSDIRAGVYKLLFIDVGLSNYLSGIDWLELQKLDDRALVNSGAQAEQFIGQHIAFSKEGLEAPRPVYWLREGRSNNAEVDYVVSSGTQIIPVEVKAGKSGSLRSLHQFVAHRQAPLAVRFDLGPTSWQSVTHTVRTSAEDTPIAFELISLPLYAVTELDRILLEYRRQNI